MPTLPQGWGIDTCLFLLLLAAFLAVNALSLLYMAFIAAGMACGTTVRQVDFIGVTLDVISDGFKCLRALLDVMAWYLT